MTALVSAKFGGSRVQMKIEKEGSERTGDARFDLKLQSQNLMLGDVVNTIGASLFGSLEEDNLLLKLGIKDFSLSYHKGVAAPEEEEEEEEEEDGKKKKLQMTKKGKKLKRKKRRTKRKTKRSTAVMKKGKRADEEEEEEEEDDSKTEEIEYACLISFHRDH